MGKIGDFRVWVRDVGLNLSVLRISRCAETHVRCTRCWLTGVGLDPEDRPILCVVQPKRGDIDAYAEAGEARVQISSITEVSKPSCN
jgi:hypothetical protein